MTSFQARVCTGVISGSRHNIETQLQVKDIKSLCFLLLFYFNDNQNLSQKITLKAGVGSVAESWFAVKTSNVPYTLKLASGENSVCRPHRKSASVELKRTSLLCCNFPSNHLVLSWIFAVNRPWNSEQTTSEIKCEPECKQEGGGAAKLLS